MATVKDRLLSATQTLKQASDQEKKRWVEEISRELQDSIQGVDAILAMRAANQITFDEAIQLIYQLSIVSRGSTLESMAITQANGERLALQITRALIGQAIK